MRITASTGIRDPRPNGRNTRYRLKPNPVIIRLFFRGPETGQARKTEAGDERSAGNRR
jgi:hypothetical protein